MRVQHYSKCLYIVLTHGFVVCKCFQCKYLVNSLLKDKILARSKFKVFADDKLKVAKMAEFVQDELENNVGKGENAGYKHFLHFQPCFLRPLSPRCPWS